MKADEILVRVAAKVRDIVLEEDIAAVGCGCGYVEWEELDDKYRGWKIITERIARTIAKELGVTAECVCEQDEAECPHCERNHEALTTLLAMGETP